MLETTAGAYPTPHHRHRRGHRRVRGAEARRRGRGAYEEKGLYFKVLDPRQFEGQRVLLVGGGDSAFDWAVNLQGIAKSIMLVHRRDGFRAHAATISQVRSCGAAGSASSAPSGR